MVGVGAWGIYAYARLLLPRGSIWPLVHFFGMWGLYSALAGCIYLEVTGPLMIPWIFYAFHRKNGIFLHFSLPSSYFQRRTMQFGLFLFCLLYGFLIDRKWELLAGKPYGLQELA
jgi:hypothetical protein